MAANLTATPRAGPARHRSFFVTRVASLLSVLPLGVWTVKHLWDQLSAFGGAEAYERAVTRYEHPVAFAATMVLVFGPLLAHTVWGIGRLVSGRPNNVRYGTYANLRYLLQRLSAIG